MEEKKKSSGFFGWLFWTVLVFAGGYMTGIYGPPAEQVLAELGVRVGPKEPVADSPPPAPPRPMSHEEEVRGLQARVGEYVGQLNTRIDEGQASLKESETSAKILLSQGESEDSEVVLRLRREQERIGEGLVQLRESLEETLALEQELRRVIDATAAVDAGLAVGDDVLLEARATLAGLDLLGLSSAASGL